MSSFFEDFTVGQRITTYGRTITEGDQFRIGKVELTGIVRFEIEQELMLPTPYRQCRVAYTFVDDFTARKGEDAVDRTALLRALTDFLKANDLKADWEGIENAPNEALVNALAMMSPYGAAEKQALLEAPDSTARAKVLVACLQMSAFAPGETPPKRAN